MDQVDLSSKGVRQLTDEQLAKVNGGVTIIDPSVSQFEEIAEELRGLIGDPEALNKRMQELMDRSLLKGVMDVLSDSTDIGSYADGEYTETENDNAQAPTDVAEASSAGTRVETGGMVIHHDMAALNTLTQLSKNQGLLSKSLDKLSSGMKINSAAEDPSGYQISERMRVQIRSLDQANYNAQNGRSMMKVAEGAVSSTVEILRTLKEKVINATNDTNTEVDREAIQKEIDASIQQIDDNALLTFNGKFLNNGARTCQGEAVANVMYTQNFTNTGEKFTDLTDKDGNDLGIDGTDLLTVSFVKAGKTYTTIVPVGDLNFSDIFALKVKSGDTSILTGDVMRLVSEEENVYDGQQGAVYTADGKPSVRIISTEAGIDGQISGISISITDQNGAQRSAANSVLDSFTEMISARNKSGDNSVALQIGANANQIMNLSMDDMRASALGLSGKGATVSVADKTSATAALKVIDNALQRALNQEASIGAVMNRLEFTSNNLTTSSENLQSAESTYRDADMAKEMTEFTKNNILMQAAQAMLAQANQQNQGVLSRLQ